MVRMDGQGLRRNMVRKVGTKNLGEKYVDIPSRVDKGHEDTCPV